MPKREEFKSALKEAMKVKDKTAVSTVRLILAALKDRDVSARSSGETEGVSDDEILSMLQTMLKQRNESIAVFRKAGREDLAEIEEAEIVVINKFLPEPIVGDELATLIAEVVAKTNAQSVKDMGKIMGVLKSDYAGRIDMGKAGGLIKAKLA